MKRKATDAHRAVRTADRRALRYAAEGVGDEELAAAKFADPLRRAFYSRVERVVRSLAETLEPEVLSKAAAAPKDDLALVRALASPESLDSLSQEDAFAEARLRGIETRRQLLEAQGGSLRSEEAQARLDLSRQGLNKRRTNNRLLGLSTGKRGYQYPLWQFDDRATQGVLVGLEDVLGALADLDPWTQLAFMVNGNALLGGLSPVAALRKGRVEEVVRAARAYGEQGGS